jgi:methylisocitrate lyase
MVIFPQTIFRATMRTAEELLRDLKANGTQESWLERMQTRKELYALLDYDPTKENVQRSTSNLQRPSQKD